MTETRYDTTKPPIRDIAGQVFGKLTAVQWMGRKINSASRPHFWKFRCECGRELCCASYSVEGGSTKSCGCSRKAPRVHSRYLPSRTPEYWVWHAMKARCEKPADKSWSRYGGRGIRICQRWSSSFENFRSDMGPRPIGHSLDRIDNDGHYSCGTCAECAAYGWTINVRWATSSAQARNKRSNVVLEHDGKRMCIVDWAKEKGLPVPTLYNRIFISGWTPEVALSTPAQSRDKIEQGRMRNASGRYV